MDSSVITPTTACAPAVVDALVPPGTAPAATALHIAVETWLSRETSAHGHTGPTTPASSVESAAAYAAAPAMSFRTRNDVQGSPPRGAPV